MGTSTGKAPPWVWTRRQLARQWGLFPADLGRYAQREINLELRLWNIEAEVEAWKPRG